MLKKSYQALANCCQVLTFGLLTGALLCSSALAESNEQAQVESSSVSEAAVHALSQKGQQSQKSLHTPQVDSSKLSSEGTVETEVDDSHSPLLLEAMHQPKTTVESVTKETVVNEQALEASVAKSNVAEESKVLASEHKVDLEPSTAPTGLTDPTVKESSNHEASSATASAQVATEQAPAVQKATSSQANNADNLQGHPLESAGQNKFGSFRSSQNQNKGALSEGLNTPAGIFQWMISTVGVLVLIFVLAYLFRKSRFIQKAVGTMQIESQIALGQKERLMRVKVGERSLLLGVTANNINLIMDLGSNSTDKQSQENLDKSSADTKEHTAFEEESQFSAAYKSAQDAYSRKQYEEILLNLSQVAAAAAASAAVQAVREVCGAPIVSASADPKPSTQGEMQGKFTDTAVDNAAYKADQSVEHLDQDDSSQENINSYTSPLVKEPFKAIVEPHANEAHHIANHFSSEHTIVRASKSTPFMGAQFGLPPDKEVLHARAQRSKQYAKELELQGRPRLGGSESQEINPLIDGLAYHDSEQAKEVNLSQARGGRHTTMAQPETQGQADVNAQPEAMAHFGEYFDSAMQTLSSGKGSSTMAEAEPWRAEDDLAQELERQERHK